MALILGIDTGGTYTDGVIIDSLSKEILCKAKAMTTKENLIIGIKNCLENLNLANASEISLVSLSTTLATNAIVEGRGCRVGLILIGEDLEEETSAECTLRIKGRFDIMGRSKEELDLEDARAQISAIKGKVDAIAISGYASVRNPKHEKIVRDLVKELLDLPIVCAHQLTSALGFYLRTITAVLNAKLIPIIEDLILSTKEALNIYNISSPLMIVKGDGTLMPEKTAKEKPIETILSGPAASVMGGAFLTGKEESLILDMGGTTTDIAYIEDSKVKIKPEGAKVGGFMTRVKAAEISTFGLGGDSHIFLNQEGNIEVGPEKAIPLSYMGKNYPYLINEMRSFRRHGEYKSYTSYEADCYILLSESRNTKNDEKFNKVIEALKDGPHSLSHIAAIIDAEPATLDMTPLVKAGVLGRISVTPTDILHAQGIYTDWDEDIAKVGVEILAKRMEISTDKFLSKASELIKNKLCMTVLQSICDFEGKELDLQNSKEAMYLIDKVLFKAKNVLLQNVITVQKPIVCIGAPVKAWVNVLNEKLQTEILIPDHGEVANAIGAAVGQVMEEVEMSISIDNKANKFILNTPWSRDTYGTLEEAMFYAVHLGRKHIEEKLGEAGCGRPEIVEAYEDVNVQINENGEKEFAGKKIKITGVGKLNG